MSKKSRGNGSQHGGARPVDHVKEFLPAAAGWRMVILDVDSLPYCHSHDCPGHVHSSVEEIEAVFAEREFSSLIQISGIAAWGVMRTEHGQQLLPCAPDHHSALRAGGAMHPWHAGWLAILAPGDLLPAWTEGAALLQATFALCETHAPTEEWLDELFARWRLDSVLDH